MEITLVVYKAVSKRVSIEFPLYYKSEYLGDNYQDESYVMVIENGTQITISKDNEDTVAWRKEKIDFYTDFPEELFGGKYDGNMRYTLISQEDFLQQYYKFIKEATLND